MPFLVEFHIKQIGILDVHFSVVTLLAVLVFVVQENQDLLIKCISHDLGFSGGRPIAACVIYKCLLHWRSFEVERTSVFDRIIQTIGSAIEVLKRFLRVCWILQYNGVSGVNCHRACPLLSYTNLILYNIIVNEAPPSMLLLFGITLLIDYTTFSTM